MRGGAQSHLFETEDGRYFVVKFQNNPQHRRILVNELIASVFLRYLQIATPNSAIISISKEFLEENPDVYLQLGSRKIPAKPGWHFGSQFPGDPARVAVYDFLPDALLKRVNNLPHFRGVLVVDKWMGNADGRQSIYFRARIGEWTPGQGSQPHRIGFLAHMIDQGYIFNGPEWQFSDSPIQGLAPRPLVYEGVKSWDDFQPWLDQVMHFPEEVVDEACKQIPPQWLNGDEHALEQLLVKLLRRRRRVADLISDCRCAKVNPFPNWR
jgi:hypothetical protein